MQHPWFEQESSVGVATRPPHVVVAEGDDEYRHVLAAALRREGCEVVTARDREELADHLGSLCILDDLPDLLIADLRIPGGAGAIESLREASWHVPLIVIAGLDQSRDAVLLDPIAILDGDDMDAFHAAVQHALHLDHPW